MRSDSEYRSAITRPPSTYFGALIGVTRVPPTDSRSTLECGAHVPLARARAGHRGPRPRRVVRACGGAAGALAARRHAAVARPGGIVPAGGVPRRRADGAARRVAHGS